MVEVSRAKTYNQGGSPPPFDSPSIRYPVILSGYYTTPRQTSPGVARDAVSTDVDWRSA